MNNFPWAERPPSPPWLRHCGHYPSSKRIHDNSLPHAEIAQVLKVKSSQQYNWVGQESNLLNGWHLLSASRFYILYCEQVSVMRGCHGTVNLLLNNFSTDAYRYFTHATITPTDGHSFFHLTNFKSVSLMPFSCIRYMYIYTKMSSYPHLYRNGFVPTSATLPRKVGSWTPSRADQ